MEAVARVERCRENGAMDNKRSPQRRPASTERFSRSSYGRSRQTEPGRRPSVQGESAPTPRRVSRGEYERARAHKRRRTAFIALAVAAAVQCPYCIDSYTQSCLEKGVTEEQMTEAFHVANAIRGGAALVHGVQMKNVVKQLEM